MIMAPVVELVGTLTLIFVTSTVLFVAGYAALSLGLRMVCVLFQNVATLLGISRLFLRLAFRRKHVKEKFPDALDSVWKEEDQRRKEFDDDMTRFRRDIQVETLRHVSLKGGTPVDDLVQKVAEDLGCGPVWGDDPREEDTP